MVIVVLEHAHCGTTMVAGILHNLGVPMMVGNFCHYEDEVVRDALINDEQEFARIVARRDRKFPVWGFKYPGAWHYAKTLKKYLKKSVYFSIYKDPISVTRRRFGKLSTNRVDSTIRQMAMSIDGMRYSRLKINCLAYSDVYWRPRWFVENIATIAGLQPCDEQIKLAVESIRPNKTDNPLRKYA